MNRRVDEAFMANAGVRVGYPRPVNPDGWRLTPAGIRIPAEATRTAYCMGPDRHRIISAAFTIAMPARRDAANGRRCLHRQYQHVCRVDRTEHQLRQIMPVLQTENFRPNATYRNAVHVRPPRSRLTTGHRPPSSQHVSRIPDHTPKTSVNRCTIRGREEECQAQVHTLSPSIRVRAPATRREPIRGPE